jgi:hypothetical protein
VNKQANYTITQAVGKDLEVSRQMLNATQHSKERNTENVNPVMLFHANGLSLR